MNIAAAESSGECGFFSCVVGCVLLCAVTGEALFEIGALGGIIAAAHIAY